MRGITGTFHLLYDIRALNCVTLRQNTVLLQAVTWKEETTSCKSYPVRDILMALTLHSLPAQIQAH